MRIILLLICLISINCEAKQPRSYHAIKQFKLENPCPANGRHKGRCPGYVIDHRVALCVGGLDSPKNMRWMTKENAKLKDKWECKAGWQDKLSECEINGCFVNR